MEPESGKRHTPAYRNTGRRPKERVYGLLPTVE
jgi:hypothetical protein